MSPGAVEAAGLWQPSHLSHGSDALQRAMNFTFLKVCLRSIAALIQPLPPRKCLLTGMTVFQAQD
jgi:hypothetical protein